MPYIHCLVEHELEFKVGSVHGKHGINLVWEKSLVSLLIMENNVYYGNWSIKHEEERILMSQLARSRDFSALLQ